MITSVLFEDFPFPVEVEVSRFQALTAILEETELIDHVDPYPLPFESLDVLETIDFLTQSFNSVTFSSRFKPVFLEVANFLDDQRFLSLIDNCRQEILQGQISLQGMGPSYLEILFDVCRQKFYSTGQVARLLEHETLRASWNNIYHYFPLIVDQNEYRTLNLILKAYDLSLDQLKIDESQYINFLDRYDLGYLYWAVQYELFFMVEYLIDHFKLTKDWVRKEIDQVLGLAASQGNLMMIQYLIKALELTQFDIDLEEVLACAATAGHLEVVQFLIQSFKIIITNYQFVHYFIKQTLFRGHLEIVQELNRFFNLEIIDTYSLISQFVSEWATCSYLKVVQYLIKIVKLTPSFKLHELPENSQLKSLRDLVIYFSRNIKNTTIQSLHLKVICYLIKDFDLEDLQTFIHKSLYQSALHGHLEVMKYLINSFELIQFKDVFENHLKIAASQGHLEVIKYLVGHFKLTFEDIQNVDILAEAAAEGHLEVVKYLVNHFKLTLKDIQSKNNWILCRAGSRGHLELVKYLISRFGLNQEDIQSKNNWILHYAADRGHLEVVKYVVTQFHLTLEDIQSNNYHCLYWAIANGHLKVIQYLVNHFHLNREDIINQIDSKALAWAADNGGLKVIQYVVEYFDLTREDIRKDHNYVLRMVIRYNRLDVLRYLMTHFNLTLKDLQSQKNEALRYIEFFYSREIIRYLEEYFNLPLNDLKA